MLLNFSMVLYEHLFATSPDGKNFYLLEQETLLLNAGIKFANSVNYYNTTIIIDTLWEQGNPSIFNFYVGIEMKQVGSMLLLSKYLRI